MSMRRLIPIAVMLLAVAVAAMVAYRADKRLDALLAERAKLLQSIADIQSERDNALDDVARLSLALRETREKREDTQSVGLEPADSSADDMASAAEFLLLGDAQKAGEEKTENSESDDNPISEEKSEAVRKERDERRQQKYEERRAQAMSFLQQKLDGTSDPAAQQRIVSIAEHLDAMLEIRQQMRDAQTDLERDQARERMHQAEANLQDLVWQQQDFLLRKVAEENGITEPARQAAIANAFFQLQQNPFFSIKSDEWVELMNKIGKTWRD